MLQTRAEAAGLVLSLQRSALGRGVAWFAIAGIAAIALLFSVLLLIAFGTPENYRVAALGLTSLALLAAAVFCGLHARSQMTRDAALIADFTTGLRLDLAMVNLALKDADTEDENKIAERERAKVKVREAVVAKAAAPSTAEDTDRPAADGPSMASDTAEALNPRPYSNGADSQQRADDARRQHGTT